MALFKENRKMSEKSVFPETVSPEMTSQSFPVSRFWSRGFVPCRKRSLTLLVHQNTGKENRYRNMFFAILISTLWRFFLANEKKKSVKYTLQKLLRGETVLTFANQNVNIFVGQRKPTYCSKISEKTEFDGM